MTDDASPAARRLRSCAPPGSAVTRTNEARAAAVARRCCPPQFAGAAAAVAVAEEPQQGRGRSTIHNSKWCVYDDVAASRGVGGVQSYSEAARSTGVPACRSLGTRWAGRHSI